MEMELFTRKPFDIQAVQITEENIEEIAAIIGRLDCNDKSGNVPIIVVSPAVISGVKSVRPGWWLTRIDNSYRVYSDRVFKSLFESKHNRTVVTMNFSES